MLILPRLMNQPLMCDGVFVDPQTLPHQVLSNRPGSFRVIVAI